MIIAEFFPLNIGIVLNYHYHDNFTAYLIKILSVVRQCDQMYWSGFPAGIVLSGPYKFLLSVSTRVIPSMFYLGLAQSVLPAGPDFDPVSILGQAIRKNYLQE